MAVIGPSLKWLDEFSSSWVFSTEDGSFGTREMSETTDSLPPSPSSPQYSSFSTCPAIAQRFLTVIGSQNDSKSEKELPQKNHGDCGHPQVNFQDSVNMIRSRRLLSNDID